MDDEDDELSPTAAFKALGSARDSAIFYQDRDTGPALLAGGEDQWRIAEPARKTFMIERCDPVGDKHHLTEASTTVYERDLPFYETVKQIALIDKRWSTHRLILYYLLDGENLYWLNGTSPPLHEVNAKAPLKLDAQNVAAYHRFFCFFVRGEEGPFFIAEALDDPLMPQTMDDSTRTIFEDNLKPLAINGQNEQGHYLCDCVVFYSNALFTANFAIQPTGMVEMLDDTPIAADLPVRIDAPVS